MVVVRCTARLLKLLAPVELADAQPAPDDWYANLIWIDRRKTLLVVHADTLFSVFVADVRKPQLSKLDYLAGTVATALADRTSRPTVWVRWTPRGFRLLARPAAASWDS